VKQLELFTSQATPLIEKLLPLLDPRNEPLLQSDLGYVTQLYRQIKGLLDFTVGFPYPSLIHLLKYLYNELESASMEPEISMDKLREMHLAMQDLSNGLKQLCQSRRCTPFPAPPEKCPSPPSPLSSKKRLFESLSPLHRDAQALKDFAEEYLHILMQMESLVRQLSPDRSPKAPLTSILRILHGMKGTSCFFIDLAPNITRLCHEFETVLTLAQEDSSQRLSSSKIDCIGKMVHILELVLMQLKQRVESQETPHQSLDLEPVFLGLKKMSEGEFVEPESILNNQMAPPGMDHSIRVSAGRMDHLAYDVHGIRLELEELKRDLHKFPGTLRELARLERSILSIQNQVLDFRLFPVGQVFQRFTLQVRELCHKLKKDVQLSFKGTETRIDKGVSEILITALTHLISNAIAHGIEKPMDRELAGKPRIGALLLSASCRGNHVVLEASDDGKGMNLEKIRERAKEIDIPSENLSPDEELLAYLTHPGFSTEKKLSHTMGRGLGLAMVREQIENLGGRLEIENADLRGTTFRMIIPLTFYTCESLVLQSGNHRFTVLMDQVHTILESSAANSHPEAKHETLRWMNRELEILDLKESLPSHSPKTNSNQILVVEDTKRRFFALMVEKCLAREHLLVRPMNHPCLQSIPFSSSASLLPSGHLSCVLDLESYYDLQKSSIPLKAPQTRNLNSKIDSNPCEDFQGKGLIFRVGYTEVALPVLSLKEVLEYVDPTPVPIPSDLILGIVHLRGQVIPVLNLPRILGQPEESPSTETCILVTLTMGYLTGLLCHGLRGILSLEIITSPDSNSKTGLRKFKAEGIHGIALDPEKVLRYSLLRMGDEQGRGIHAN
jgi:chemotaxis protein histidine kinase CheA